MKARWHGEAVMDYGDANEIAEQRAFLARRAEAFADYVRVVNVPGVTVELLSGGSRRSLSVYVYLRVDGVPVKVRFSDHPGADAGEADVEWRYRVTNSRLFTDALEVVRG